MRISRELRWGPKAGRVVLEKKAGLEGWGRVNAMFFGKSGLFSLSNSKFPEKYSFYVEHFGIPHFSREVRGAPWNFCVFLENYVVHLGILRIS